MFNKLIHSVLLSSYKTASGSRSSKRTDMLHNGFMNILEPLIDSDLLSSTKILHEETVKSPNNPEDTFSIDVLLKSNNYDIALLFKLIASSYNKNRNNYRDTTIGERFRFLANDLGHRRKLAHINILPTFAPVFDKKGVIKKVEKVNPQNIDKWDDYLNFPNAPIEAKLLFEIDPDILNNAKDRYNLFLLMKEAGTACVEVKNEKTFMNQILGFLEK